MSKVFTELVNLGMSEESATEIQQSLSIHDNLVTKDYLDKRLAETESGLYRHINLTMLGMTAIFGLFMTIAAWLVKP